MKTIFTNSYPYKHWLTSIAVGPLIYMTYESFVTENSTFNDFIGTYILFLTFGLLLSLPVLILYLLLFSLLIKTIRSTLIIKTILNITTIVGIAFTIKLIGGTLMTSSLVAFYSIALIISSFIYKIKKQNSADT
jgi:Sec-independent protein secretion pathway component TatC